MKRLVCAAALLVALSGCAPVAPAPSSTPVAVETANAISAADIASIEDGIEWARGLDKSATSTEISTGVNKIGDLVPDLDIWFSTSNEIGMALISLNVEVNADPSNAGTYVDNLGVIVDDIEAAIAHGPNP